MAYPFTNMHVPATATIKRQRDEDDAIDASGLLTPESSVGHVYMSATYSNKKFKPGLGQHGDDHAQSECSDETMSDISEPIGPSIPHAEMISHLGIDVLRDIVKVLSARSTYAQDLVETAYSRVSQKPDVGRYAIEVEEIFGSRSKRYSVPGMAYADVKSSIAAVAEWVERQSSYDAKKSALDALQDIALSILRADRSRQAIEVRGQFEQDDCIPQLMLQIVRGMSVEERITVSGEMTIQGSTFARTLQYLHEKAVENYIAGFYDFAIVLDTLSDSAGSRQT